jgi:hypothetical protein
MSEFSHHDKINKFIFDVELMRTFFLGYSFGIIDPADANNRVKQIVADWEGKVPAFLGSELEIQFKLDREASVRFLKQFTDAFELIKGGVEAGPDTNAYSRLTPFDERFCPW